MLLLACALAVPTLASTPITPDAWSASPLAEFLASAPSAVVTRESDRGDAADSLLSYTYAEIGVAQNDVDDFDENVDIYYVRGSLNLLHFFYVFGEYSNQSSDFQDSDSDQITLGAGAHLGVLPALDVIGELGAIFSDTSSDVNSLDGSETGYRASLGARWLVLPWATGGLEVNAVVGTIDLDNRLGSDDNPTYYGIGARAHFMKFLSVGVNLEQIEDDDMLLGSVRWSF